MEQTDRTPRRNPYRKRGPRAWALIQARYLAGESAPRLAEIFDVTESAIRQRIRRQGWSKASLAEAEEAGMPDPEEAMAEIAAAAAGTAAGLEPGLDGAELEPRAAARVALDAAVRLMRSGQMTGAAEAARVADVLARAAARLEGDAAADPGEPDEAAFEAVRRKVLGLTSLSAEADGEDRSARERRPGGGGAGAEKSGGEESGGRIARALAADTESPPPDRFAVCPPHSPDANGEVNG